MIETIVILSQTGEHSQRGTQPTRGMHNESKILSRVCLVVVLLQTLQGGEKRWQMEGTQHHAACL